MESNDENYGSGEESNSVSTDAKNERLSVNNDKCTRKASNVVFVSPNELENWDLDEPKSKVKRASKSRKSIPRQSKTSKTPRSKKRKGRPKKKKDSNPWSSDMEDESLGLENEVSDDEYFRRLEADENVIESIIHHKPVEGKSDMEYDDKEEEEDIFIDNLQSFDPNNSDLINYIISERENSLDINDVSKPIIQFPISSEDLKCPHNQILHLLSIYETVIQYCTILRISPFKIEDFIAAMVNNENSVLLSELHMSIMKYLLREDDVYSTSLCPIDQKEVVNFAFYLMDFMTWPELMRFYIESLDNHHVKLQISPSYPFVPLIERIKVLLFLLDQFIYCNSVRNEIGRESNLGSEDFCRVCHLSGEVLCCDTCTAVYHLDCLTPKLTEVPKTAWICSICLRHRIDGLYNCNFDGDKAIVEHKKTPLGNDRFGNTYWFLARRLIIEPRNDNIENLVDWNKNEVDYQPNYHNVIYYSTWNAVKQLRKELSKDWEEELCSVLDGLEDEMKKSMRVTLKLTDKGIQRLSKHPKILEKSLSFVSILKEEINGYIGKENGQNDELSLNKEDQDKASEEESEVIEEDQPFDNEEELVQNCQCKTVAGQQVGVIEDQEGLFVRNIDANTIRVRLSAKTRSNQLDEIANRFNYDIKHQEIDPHSKVFYYRLGDEGDWRLYENAYTTDLEALSKLQHQEDKDKFKLLANKFGINDTNEFQWFVSQSVNRACWPSDKLPIKRGTLDILGGPLNMLHCIRLTLQNMEAQMFSSFMCPGWKNERKNWLINIQRTRNSANLADFVAAFENSIRPCAFRPPWTNTLGMLQLDRVTLADKEEDKRLKALEKKMGKTDNDVVKTRNPGLLKHAIWKVKGEEYRRNGGDGWSWLGCTSLVSTASLYTSIQVDCSENYIKKTEMKSNDSFNYDITNVDESNSKSTLDKLLNIRDAEFAKSVNACSFEDARNKLNEYNKEATNLQNKKKELEEKLERVIKEHRLLQMRNTVFRKRPYSHYDNDSNNKRMKFDRIGGQYDGVDDDDDEEEDEDDEEEDEEEERNHSRNNMNQSSSVPLSQNNTPVSNINVISDNRQFQQISMNAVSLNSANLAGVKPVIINSQPNRFCLVNAPGRIMLNNAQVTGASTITANSWNAPQYLRLSNNQLCKIVTPQMGTKNFIAANPVNPTHGIRKMVPGTNSQQFIMVNSIPNGQISTHQPIVSNTGGLVYSVSATNTNNTIRLGTPLSTTGVPITTVTSTLNNSPNVIGGMQSSQYKRLLPLDPSMFQQAQQLRQVQPQNQQFSQNMAMIQQAHLQHQQQINVQQRFTNSTNINIMPNNNIQGRRSISKTNHNTDIKLTPMINTDEVDKQREIDSLTSQMIEIVTKLEHNQRLIDDMKYQLKQTNTFVGFEFSLMEPTPEEHGNLINFAINDEVANKHYVPLPVRNLYKWPESCDTEKDSKFVKSIFINKSENLRNLVLSGGKVDIPGFDVEKKRIATTWNYPTARPNFSTTWRYRLSEIVNSDPPLLDNSKLLEICQTEPIESNKFSTGSFNLASIALNIKMLWYTLRWNEMMANFPSSTGGITIGNSIATQNTSQNGMYKETLSNGDVVERKIIAWRPLDLSCSILEYKVITCTTTTAQKAMNVSTNKSMLDDSFGGNTSDLSSTVASVKSSRRARRPIAARYADTDHFTDDGERDDSDDSDPSFVPGMVNRTPKTRGRKSRGRNGGTDDSGISGGSHTVQKVYREQWLHEDELELFEIRDFLMRTQWNRGFISQSNHNYGTLIQSNFSKMAFLRPENPMPILRSTLPQNNATYISNSTNLINSSNVSATPNLPLGTMSMPVSNTDHTSSNISTSIRPIESANLQTSNISNNLVPIAINANQLNNNKLIIESSSASSNQIQRPFVSTIPSNSNVPQTSQTINLAIQPNSNIVFSNIIPTVPSNTNIPQPITDIREISTSNISVPPTPGRFPVQMTTTAVRANNTQNPKVRGRGRGRGRPPLCNAPGSINSEDLNISNSSVILPSLPSVSAEVDSSEQLMNLTEHLDKAAEQVTERSSAMHEMLLEISAVKTLETMNLQHRQQIQLEEEVKKKRVTKRDVDYKKSFNDIDDDEETDAEIDTASTSPAVNAAAGKSMETVNKSNNVQNKNIVNHVIKSNKEESDSESLDEEDNDSVTNDFNQSENSDDPSTISQEEENRKPVVKSKPNKIKLEKSKMDTNNHVKSQSSGLQRNKRRYNEIYDDTSSHQSQSINDNDSGEGFEEQLYCICQTPHDKNENYICCDICDNWYHFKCVNMDSKRAKKIQFYKCVKCEQKEQKPVQVQTKKVSRRHGEKKETRSDNVMSNKRDNIIVEHMGEDENEMYCCCRTKYDAAKMYIGCDFCDEWYHPKCVGLTDLLASTYEGEYKCPICIKKDDMSSNAPPDAKKRKYAEIDCQKRIDSSLKKKLLGLINSVMNHPNALPFFKSFKPDDYPKYYQVVKNPMDLLTVQANLEKSKYKNIGNFKLDVESIFVGCSTFFNSTSHELISAKKLEKYFHKELKSLIC